MSHAFLVELGTEELPPVSLKTLIRAFENSVCDSLKASAIAFDSVESFATPRRLALLIVGLPQHTDLKKETIWGPPARVAFKDGIATKAAEAFAKKNNVKIDDLGQANDGKEDKLVCEKQTGGEKISELMPQFVSEALNSLPISKRMRWGAARTEFVRPVQWLVMLWDQTIIESEILGVKASNFSIGHRFHCSEKLIIENATDYKKIMRAGFVIADFEERRNLIIKQVHAEAEKIGGKAVIEDELLDEVTALNEWPVALAGKFDKAFLEVPPEALISSMAEHQKYFHVVDENQNLMPNFITVANIESKDPQLVISGNEKVIRPRLADAAFFFETDKKISQTERREKLKTVTFQGKLGSIFDKTERIAKLAEHIAIQLKFDAQLAKRAAELSKSDLVSNMVYEFTDLQGVAGEYYAKNDGEPDEVSKAITEQYLPKFAGDKLPETQTGSILALADRLDTIVGIFGLGQIPSGSKDPFGLRRASISVLRILVEKNYDLDLRELIARALSLYPELPKGDETTQITLEYMLDRFKAWYGEAGIKPEVFQSVSAKNLSRPLDIDNRVQAVAAFTELKQASALAEANKRVTNILAKLGYAPSTQLDPNLLEIHAEQVLAEMVSLLREQVDPLFKKAEYKQALQLLAQLQQPIDDFFDDVMVMTEDEKVRNNRLSLLQILRDMFFEVADISYLVLKK